ncbi:calcium-binding protein [Nonomuraea sp. NPDC000554]|uniref:calcium-binding protein n=1 Tax=Nonomuraea sp. NPDC000554 TaxID=3154259 RepID=UPI00331A31C4
MHALRRLTSSTLTLTTLTLVLALTASVPAARAQADPPAQADCDVGRGVVDGVNAGGDWAPVTPSKWQFPGDQVILAEAGVSRPGPRRPFEYAVLKSGPAFGSVQIDAEVRLDTPTSISNRDVIIVFGYRSDTEFYYVHLSQDNTIYPHNGIFVVNNADRLRIDDQWNGHVGAPPAVTDMEWHKVRVRHCTGTGRISVFVNDSPTPLITATDRTFTSGRVGFGSFDNIGRMRDMKVTGTPICGGLPTTITGTPGRDLLTGTPSPDVIAGLGGDDVIRGLGGDDVLCGGDGRDVILGGDGDDTLYGGADADVLKGGHGDDRLYRDSPRDVLTGGPGDDTKLTEQP